MITLGITLSLSAHMLLCVLAHILAHTLVYTPVISPAYNQAEHPLWTATVRGSEINMGSVIRAEVTADSNNYKDVKDLKEKINRFFFFFFK